MVKSNSRNKVLQHSSRVIVTLLSLRPNATIIVKQTLKCCLPCSALLDLVEAPGAFIMGCHSRHKSQIQRVVKEMDEV